MNKKRTFFCALLIGVCALFSACAIGGIIFGWSYQKGFQYAIYKDGVWGKWRPAYYDMKSAFYTDHFVIYPYFNHPSNYAIKVTCKNEISKDGGWHKYNGTIEYYTKYYPDSFYLDKFPYGWPSQAVKETGIWNSRNAKIWIRRGKFKNAYTGHTINIFFDENTGFGLGPLQQE
ncbi:hypothetical protein [uncultured Rikenella sp.]|uniref:hypothetical protein n=1 Tax=uncultured Rikenella sp. TaxID=368003 RepID=UPI0025E019F3|nr:hypothetical protein [uncultured Rikenella sp.]